MALVVALRDDVGQASRSAGESRDPTRQLGVARVNLSHLHGRMANTFLELEQVKV